MRANVGSHYNPQRLQRLFANGVRWIMILRPLERETSRTHQCGKRLLYWNDQSWQVCSVICLELLQDKDNVRVLRCKHVYHTQCFDRWFAGHSVCPLCHGEILETKQTKWNRAESIQCWPSSRREARYRLIAAFSLYLSLLPGTSKCLPIMVRQTQVLLYQQTAPSFVGRPFEVHSN